MKTILLFLLVFVCSSVYAQQINSNIQYKTKGLANTSNALESTSKVQIDRNTFDARGALTNEQEQNLNRALNASEGSNLISSEKSEPNISKQSIETRLIELKKLQENGLITQKDYDNKKTEILKSM